MDKPARALVVALRDGLAELADPAKAPDMQRYMRSDMPFRGVQKPARRALATRVFPAFPLPDKDSWLAAVTELWREATYREERYLAIELTGRRNYDRWQQPDLVPLYGELIETGAWWDFVDEIAIQRIGPLLRAFPGELTPILRGWATGEDRWKRRTAVICQIGSKKDTDLALLSDSVRANLADPDFFLRKGIGWALRAHAKIDPDWVRRFVDQHPEMSALSKREARKHLT
ncbi:MAG: DNA alkylation repair protein [Pseudonocardiaceae bacterium]|nr:DNA alkylation repair protein [Pseudonocardiaceae bacterium]